MGVSFGLQRMRLADGSVIEPPMDGMTVLIGPNNSGKSLLLREIYQMLHTHPGELENRRWINSLDIYKEGSGEEFITWLERRGRQPRTDPRTGRTYLPGGPGSSEPGLEIPQAVRLWNNLTIGPLLHFLVIGHWTAERLNDQSGSSQWDFSRPPTHPTQKLWENKAAHALFSNWIESAFGEPVTINRYEQAIRLQLGSTRMEDTPPPPPPELRDAYARLPFLADQGDGMRAFVNIALHTLVTAPPVIIIDEPEAFLHPPQARLLGRYLAMFTPSPCQIIVATHSAEFLGGVMEGNSVSQSARPLVLARISRTGGVPASRFLPSEAVGEILSAPLLRYSNIISGLFHDGVVLCEAEGDCAFYAATLDAVRAAGPHENLTFLHVNGKARLSDAAKKLRACGIPTAVIADLDFLNEATKVKQALASLGGNWDDVKDDFQVLQTHASSAVVVRPAAEIKREIVEIIGNPRGREVLSQQKLDKIIDHLKMANGWKTLKSSGLAGLNGEPHNAVKRLLDYFAARGFFLVPVGELECWVRNVSGSNKSLWLERVFSEGHHKEPSGDLREFITGIVSYLVSAQ